MSVIILTLFMALLPAPPASAAHGNIYIYTTPYVDAACLEQNSPLTLNVWGRVFVPNATGLQGAEYSIQRSRDTDWLYVEDFAASTAVGGIVLGTGSLSGASPGINIGFATCQTSRYREVLLQTITVIDLTGDFAGQVVTLQVQGHTMPSNPFFRCPLLVLCDAPVFSKVCLGSNITTNICPFPPGAQACFESTSGRFTLNFDPNDGPFGSDCTVAVEERTWSQMKSLYN